MAVENTGSLISDLDDTLPRPDDYISEGDDHIRLIKHNLKYTFPNITAVVSASSDKLNQLDSAFEFSTANGLPKVSFQNPTLFSNGLNAVAGTDYQATLNATSPIVISNDQTPYHTGRVIRVSRNPSPEFPRPMSRRRPNPHSYPHD